MRRVAPLALLLALAACSPRAERSDSVTSAQSDPSAAVQQPAGGATPAASTVVAPPGPGDTPRYVGRWASRADLCEGGAWTFTRDSAALEDGPTCHFDAVEEIPGGYQVTATCEQGGKSRKGMATLRFAESARAMLVENLATLPDTGLVYCGSAPQSSEGATK